MELREAFSYYKTQVSTNPGDVQRIMRLLCLGGIHTMEQLSEVVGQQPEKILSFRGIGPEYAEQVIKIVQFFNSDVRKTDQA